MGERQVCRLAPEPEACRVAAYYQEAPPGRDELELVELEADPWG